MCIANTVGSPNAIAAVAALVIVFASGNAVWAADPITARAGSARVDVTKPSGPTPMVRRGLILPPDMIDAYAQPFVDRPVGGGPLRLGATLGMLWGIAPEVHADFQVTPFYLPEFAPGPVRLAITGRLVKTRPIDLGIGFVAWFDPEAPSALGFVQPGIATILRPSGLPRVDTGVQLPLYTTNADPHFGLRVPLGVYFQITDRIHFGSTSALSIADLRDPRATASIPIGLTAGYSAGPELDFAAFTPYVSWTNFYSPGSGTVDTRSFVVGLIADVAVKLP